MNCLRVSDEIKAYIDGELGPVTRLRVARHIARCPECREEMTAMAELTNELKSASQVSAPQGLRQAVMGRMEFRPVQAIRSRWPYQTSPVTVALLLLGILVFGAVLFPVFQRSKSSAPEMQAKMAVRRAIQGPQPGSAPMPAAAEAPAASPALPRADLEKKGKGVRFAGDSDVFAGDFDLNVVGKVHDSTTANATIDYRKYLEQQPASNLMIIKTADLSVRVKDFDTAYNQAVSIAKSTGGYVTDSAAQNDGASPTSGNLTMRVPVSAFERTLERLGKLGKFTSKSISGEDVSGEVVDLEARLRNKRAEERQYLDIMNRAKRVPDIVTVTNELSRVRGEIEEAQGRMKYLQSSVAMSTINLTLSEKEKPTPVKSSIERTWGNAIGALAGAGNRLLALGIWLVVFSPFWALPLGLWAYARKKAERTSAACSGEATS